jgi:hypothetical protein
MSVKFCDHTPFFRPSWGSTLHLLNRRFAKNADPRLASFGPPGLGLDPLLSFETISGPGPRKFRERILVFLGLLILAMLLCSACAKVGEPQPPMVYVARPSLDLSCKQISDQIVLSVSVPSINTNGTPVNSLKMVEVFRVDADPAQAAGQIAEGNFLKEGIKIVSVSEAEFPKYKLGNKFVFSDSLPLHQGGDIYSKMRIYSVRFFNRKGQTAGLGNRASLVPVPVPVPPTLLSSEITQNSIRLRWAPPTENIDGSKPARILGYNIYRSMNSQNLPDTPLNSQLLPQPEYDDHSFEFDKAYAYAVSIVASEKAPFAESSLSKMFSVTPRDAFPPGVPGNLNAVAENGIVVLLWVPPSDSDVAGYRVYRSDSGSKMNSLLNAELIPAFSYQDKTVQQGKIYVFSVTAVDKHNNESTAASTTIELP